jgi:SAM-dependent methyltransferase
MPARDSAPLLPPLPRPGLHPNPIARILMGRRDRAQSVVVSAAGMPANTSAFQYPLGNTDAEHQRLIRQAAWLAPYTERCFREAGIGSGQRVLDLGSGVGDVALLAARLVGPSGEVVGVERDARSIARARVRVAEAGLDNVTFIQADALQIAANKPFDAAVGRYILMFLPDPAAVVRSLCLSVRPGGVVVFQEASLTSFFRLAAPLPLWAAGASLVEEAFRRAGTCTEMAPALPGIFQDAGLPPPSIRTEILLGAEEWMPGLLRSLRPQSRRIGLAFEPLGDFATLSARLKVELAAAHTAAPLPSLVSAWSRKPGSHDSR